MAEQVPLGSARLYSLTAAVTCPSCGLPMFIVRPGTEGEQVDRIVKCPKCGEFSFLNIFLTEEEPK